MSAPARLVNVAVNEWGVPEPTPAQEAFAEDVAEHAGCPDLRCDELVICTPCGQPVCREHTTEFSQCAEEVAVHHAACVADCGWCRDEIARDWATHLATDGRC